MTQDFRALGTRIAVNMAYRRPTLTARARTSGMIVEESVPMRVPTDQPSKRRVGAAGGRCKKEVRIRRAHKAGRAGTPEPCPATCRTVSVVRELIDKRGWKIASLQVGYPTKENDHEPCERI